MCCGDSITYQNGGTAGNGAYKKALASAIYAGKGYLPIAGTDFVGQTYDATSSYPMCGTPGIRSDQLNSSWLPTGVTYNPNACLLHIGTNDIAQAKTTNQIMTGISGCLNTIRNALPTCRVFLAKIIDMQLYPSNVTDVNNSLVTMVAARNDASYITFVDQYAALGAWSGTYFNDDKHPNDAGYALMATAWYNALNTIYG